MVGKTIVVINNEGKNWWEFWEEENFAMSLDRCSLAWLVAEDNVDELAKNLNSNEILRNNFNSFFSSIPVSLPLLHFAVKRNCQKVVEYLLSQDFVDKTICNSKGENIYHVICRIRGAEELFSIIERKVPHHLLLNNSYSRMNAFDIACRLNNIFIVNRVHEILQTLQFDITLSINNVMERAARYAMRYNQDIEVIKYVLSIDGIQLNDRILYRTIENSKFEVIVYLLNVYLCQSIPSHLHNQFHIFQFSNNRRNICDNINITNSSNNKNNNNNNNNNNSNNNNEYDKYSQIVEENYNNIVKMEYYGNRIWHGVCRNKNLTNLDVQLIFSLKGFQAEILNKEGFNVFLYACVLNSNIKVIKYIHKLFPSFINSQLYFHVGVQNGAYLIIRNSKLKEKSDKLNILHYLYLNGIDIHHIFKVNYAVCESLYTKVTQNKIYGIYDQNIDQYLQVISQDFDYLHNEHDHEAYRKPSFWKEIDDRNNIDEQSMGINEWKNRFEEHVLHHLSKMIQQHMLELNKTL